MSIQYSKDKNFVCYSADRGGISNVRLYCSNIDTSNMCV